jgi:hypothetical protein
MTIRNGTWNMNILSSSNKTMAIVWCQEAASKTSLQGCGLASSGHFTTMTKCAVIERMFWTKSGSLGWKADVDADSDKLWHQQHVKLVEFK